MTGVSLIGIRQLNHELGVPTVRVVESQWQALRGTILNYDSASWWNKYAVIMYELILPISIRVISLALGQSYDYPSASEATMILMGI